MSLTRQMENSSTKENPTGDVVKTRRPVIIFFRILLPLAVVAGGIILAWWMLDTSPQAEPRQQKRTAALVEVRTIDFSPQQTIISAMGTVGPARQIEMRPQVSGEIIHVSDHFQPGGLFQKGDILLKTDPIDYELAVQLFSADVTRARSELQLEQGNQLISQQEFELLGESVNDDEKNLMLRQPQLENLLAALDAARVNLKNAELDLTRTVITSPFNAVIQSRGVNVGSRVSESTSLADLIGTDAFWVEILVPASQLQWISIPAKINEKGARVKIYDPAAWGQGEFRTGRVIRLAPDLEEQGRMARIIVEVSDPLGLSAGHDGSRRMLIGAYVRVDIEGKKLPAAASIERSYLRDGDFVWIMDDQNTLDIRHVDITFKDRHQVLISAGSTAGITPGERLIVSDLASAVQGMPLRLSNDDASSVTTLKQQNADAQNSVKGTMP